MGLLGGLLGGALQGVGRGMEMQVVAKQKEAEAQRADDALARRQMALAKYQSTLNLQEEGVKHGYKINELTTELGIRGKLAAADDQRALTAAEKKAEIDYKFAIAKLEKEHGYKLSEAQQANALAIARDAATSNRDLDHYEVDSKTGELVGFTKSGRTMRSPVTPLRQLAGSGGILEAYDDGTPSDGTPKPAPQPTPASDSSGGAGPRTVTKQDRLNAINAAIAKRSQGDPRYKGLSGTQIAAKVDDMLRNQGITVK